MTSPTQSESPIYQQLVRIAAKPDTVFEFLVDPDSMKRWMGIDNVLHAAPGGIMEVNVTGNDIAKGEYVVVDRPHRVVFTWGWVGSEAMPPGASEVDITLKPEGDGTLLELIHRDCPTELLESHATGWDHFMERLSAAALGNYEPDPWVVPAEDRT